MINGYGTALQLQQDVQDLVQDVTTIGGQKILRALNRAIDEITSDGDWPQLERADEVGLEKRSDTAQTVIDSSASSFFAGPVNCERVKSITIYSPTGATMKQASAAELASDAGSELNSRTGVPYSFARVGQTAQFKPLAADGTLTMKCTSSGNDDVRDVRVRYRTSTAHLGASVTEDVLGGTFSGSGIALNSTVEAGWSIESVDLPVGWVGALTIEDASANVIVEIANVFSPGTTSGSHWVHYSRPLFRVWPNPDQDYKATVVWKERHQPLLTATDALQIPAAAAVVYKAASSIMGAERRLADAAAFNRMAEAALDRAQSGTGRVTEAIRPAYGSVLGAAGVSRRGRARYWTGYHG